MNNPIDPFAISDAFSGLHDAWQQDQEALAQCRQALSNAMKDAHDRALARMETVCSTLPDSSEDILLHWVDHWTWSSRQYHQAMCQWLAHYVDRAPELSPDIRKRAHFWVRQVRSMLEPANFFWTNPRAVQRFLQSKGESLNKGMSQWMDDISNHHGLVSLSDQNSFCVGENLAATPGEVVFRNELVELIQYAPQTEQVRRTPIVLVQPWINKYYIFDLSARNSFVAYLVRSGFSVFITSWKNPNPQMRHVTFEDYMQKGALQAVHVAREVCGCSQVHLAGYCIGGTLVATLAGWLAHEQQDSPIAGITLFSTLLDFSNPGDLSAMIHAKAFEAVQHLAEENGVLQGHHIAAAFRMLNPDDLIWRFAVNNYFYGGSPPRSDMLFWNSDSTNLPEAMCLFYLKSFYLENRLVRADALTVGQRSIDLPRVTTPVYIVGAAKDHICPWQSTFQSCRLMGGKVRYVLADEGHITGIVNPPSQWSKKKYWAGAATRLRDPDKWLRKQTPATGSWWPDWLKWLKPRSGDHVPPPGMGSKNHPPLCPAPGTYVLESHDGS